MHSFHHIPWSKLDYFPFLYSSLSFISFHRFFMFSSHLDMKRKPVIWYFSIIFSPFAIYKYIHTAHTHAYMHIKRRNGERLRRVFFLRSQLHRKPYIWWGACAWMFQMKRMKSIETANERANEMENISNKHKIYIFLIQNTNKTTTKNGYENFIF